MIIINKLTLTLELTDFEKEYVENMVEKENLDLSKFAKKLIIDKIDKYYDLHLLEASIENESEK